MTCLVCGQPHTAGMRSVDMVQVGGLTLAIARCLRCVSQDRTGAQLVARLAGRAVMDTEAFRLVKDE